MQVRYERQPCVDAFDFVPAGVNTGAWLTGYTLDELRLRIERERVVLPVCSMGTAASQLTRLAPLVLPPLYHEAFVNDAALKPALLDRIQDCFPYHVDSGRRNDTRCRLEVVELPASPPDPIGDSTRIVAFSVDTAVEEHGPHLPLATDVIQSYGVLKRLADEFDGFVVAPPADYGHLTWGLPFGLSIDATPPLLTRYVRGYVNGIADWLSPEAVYVVDVHGSPVHRAAIEAGLESSRCDRWAFRWLHEPLVEFAGDRGDQHAGGVETALVELINPGLLDSRWWPSRLDEIAAGQMTLDRAVELSGDLPEFIRVAESSQLNGVVGDIGNYERVDAAEMMTRMLDAARADVKALMEDGG